MNVLSWRLFWKWFKPVMDKKMLALLLSQAARINGYLEEMGHGSSDNQNFLILEECRHE